jgi:hypothetical protein
MPNQVVTDADRARGWAELEIEFPDGKREFVRVHALEQSFLISLARFSPSEALTRAIGKSLRVDGNFVARIAPEYQLAISAMLALLNSGDAGGTSTNAAAN